MNAFPFSERRLAHECGIARKEFKKIREKMAAGVAWDHTERGIVLSVQGFYEALTLLGLVQKKGAEVIAKEGIDLQNLQKKALVTEDDQESEEAPQKATVVRFLINRLMVSMRLDDGSTVTLRIPRGRERLRRGLVMAIRPVAGMPYWELAEPLARRLR